MADTDKHLLYFEREHLAPGRVEGLGDPQAVRPVANGLGQHLNALLDDPVAYVFDPQLVKRLRPLRDHRRDPRSASSFHMAHLRKPGTKSRAEVRLADGRRISYASSLKEQAKRWARGRERERDMGLAFVDAHLGAKTLLRDWEKNGSRP